MACINWEKAKKLKEGQESTTWNFSNGGYWLIRKLQDLSVITKKIYLILKEKRKKVTMGTKRNYSEIINQQPKLDTSTSELEQPISQDSPTTQVLDLNEHAQEQPQEQNI